MSIIKSSITILFVFIVSLASSQCPTVAPTGSDACRIDPGSVGLGASGSSGFYSWYDASSGGNFLGSGSIYNTPSISSTTTYYVAAAEENYALDFDGADDYVDLGNPSQLQITGDMTIEMWLKPYNFSDRRNPYAKAYGGEGTITQEKDGNLTYYYGTSGGNGGSYQGVSTNYKLQLNTWNHIAIVRDLTNMNIYWYVNGNLTHQVAADYSAATSGTLSAMIGDGYVSNYAGQIDEVRIWNTARTQTQIQDNKSICLVGNETGLVAYYRFNDGANSTIVADLTSNANDGNLTNMDAANDWQSSDNDYYCSSCESSRTSVVATIDNSTGVDLGLGSSIWCDNNSVILDAGSGFSSYSWNTGATTQTITVSSAGKYSVEVGNSAGCTDKDTTIVKTAGSSKNSLDFDGVDDYVDLGNSDKFKVTGNQTIEMWIYPTDYSVRRNPYSKAYGGEGTITQETSGGLTYYYGTSGANASPYQSITSDAIPLNEWSHIAIVRDLDNMKLYWYINGVLSRSTDASYSAATESNNYVSIAKGYVDNFVGQIDEFRMWKTARTQTQIRDNMCKKLYGSEAGLVAYYRFDEGSGTTLTDESLNSLDGTINGGASWSTSASPIGDQSSYIYTTNWSGVSLSHSTCDGESITVDNMSGNPVGVHIYSVNSAPSVTTGISGLGTNNRYFGVFKVNDATASYRATYDYSANAYVVWDEYLKLYKRDNNADATWVDASATLDRNNKTLEATAQGTEFVLGTTQSELPIELIKFKTIVKDKNVNIFWTTATEINNDYFTIERSNDLKNWEEILNIDGANNSNEIINYSEIDFNPLIGVSYYRLKQTDYDGTYSYSNVEVVNFDNNVPNIRIYPNPIDRNSTLTINYDKIDINFMHIELKDLLGKKYFSKDIGISVNQNEVSINMESDIPKGIYIISIILDDYVVISKKLIIN